MKELTKEPLTEEQIKEGMEKRDRTGYVFVPSRETWAEIRDKFALWALDNRYKLLDACEQILKEGKK